MNNHYRYNRLKDKIKTWIKKSYNKFGSFEIRYKFIISFSIIFFMTILLCSLFIYVFVKKNIETNIENELNNTTQMIFNMVKTSTSVSIKNYLRAIAEKNEKTIRRIYQMTLENKLTVSEAKELASTIILSQTIGVSGYVYCINSKGSVLVHPQSDLLNVNVAHFQFVSRQIESREGYIEYEWKNPGETSLRPKALYMVYFEPWDWIISASSYRNEFNELINVEDFRKSILSLKFGKTGYSFVIDSKGNAVIHPKLQGINIFNAEELPNQYLEDMLKRKKGKSIYFWKNPDEPVARQKLVIFNYIPEYHWIVASSCYLDEIYHPLKTIRDFIIWISITFFVLMLSITIKISSSITNPLHEMMRQFENVSLGNFTARVTRESNDEVGHLALYFNRFMHQLESYNKKLTAQIQERLNAQEAQKESQERYFLLMEAAPDPIVHYDIKGTVIYVNPAFLKVFGWSEKECIAHKMDHFVPEENWIETKIMIDKILSGKAINNIETRRISRHGNIVNVSVSGAPTRDRNNNLSGSIIILRDISKTKLLEKRLMQVGDRERQEIGQNLHDDLCPHLIGIAGLVAVLKGDLPNQDQEGDGLADKILLLIDDAIDKTRILARGLCPVHMVSHGIGAALEELIQTFINTPGIEFQLHVDESVEFEDNSIATHLYYIAREAVNNAVKHSGAKMIAVSILKESGFVHLSIQDNGKGMDAVVKTHGIGLQIMAYRANMINSQFDIKTNQNGLSIDVFLKYPVAASKGEPLNK